MCREQHKLDTLRAGITIDGINYGPIIARVDREQGSNSWLTMDLREGKNREIKRVLEELGFQVSRLIRISFGPFQLADLGEGAVEEVRTRVLAEQLGVELAEKANVDFEAPLMHADHISEKKGRQIRALPQSRMVDNDEPARRTEVGTTLDRRGRAVRVERIVASEKPSPDLRRKQRREMAPAADDRPRRPDGRKPRDGFSRDDKPREFKPRGDKPFGDRPPRGDRPLGDRKPFADKPRGERSARSFKPRDETGEGQRGEGFRKPYTPRESNREGGEREYKPREFKPRGDKPFGDRPPRADKPYAARGEKRFGDKPSRDGKDGSRFNHGAASPLATASRAQVARHAAVHRVAAPNLVAHGLVAHAVVAHRARPAAGTAE